MACGCGKKKKAPIARRGFAAGAAQMADDLKQRIPAPTRPATWNGNTKETKA